MRFGIRSALWRRPDLTGRFLDHYSRMVDPLREVGIDLQLVAAITGGESYLRQVRPTPCHWHFVERPNHPNSLGRKLQASLTAMRSLEPAAVLNLGSDDFVGITTIRRLAKAVARGVDFSGWSDFYYVHAQFGMKRWPGYPVRSPRAGEPIGAGRCYSARMLDALGWELWPGGGIHRLDANSWGRVKELEGRFNILPAPSSVIGPMVDVKTSESLTPWRRLSRYNQPVPIEEARVILAQVGLEGYL